MTRMTQRTEALRRLRAADPARDVEIPPPADVLTAPRQETAEGPAVADVLPVVRVRSRHPRRTAAILAAAAIVAGVAVGAVELGSGSGGTGTPSTRHGSPTPTVPMRPAGPMRTSNRDRTLTLLDRILARTPVLDGARRQSSAPVPGLRHSGFAPQSSHALDPHAWWTAPGWTPEAAYGWFRDHPPDGLRLGGWGITGAGHLSRTTLWTVSYDRSDTDYATQIELTIQIARDGSGAAVRADAVGIWLPPRPSDSLIRAPHAVHVVVRRPDARTVTRTLGATGAGKLARQLNRLRPAIPDEVRSCPADFGGSDTLVFRTPSGTVRAEDHPSGCPGVTIYRHGERLVALDGDVNGLLMRLLGLPQH